jgi:hypothetical protein
MVAGAISFLWHGLQPVRFLVLARNNPAQAEAYAT